MGVSAPLFSLDKIDSIDVFAHILYTFIMPNIHPRTHSTMDIDAYLDSLPDDIREIDVSCKKLTYLPDLSKNPAAVPLLEKYPEKIDWLTIGENPKAMHLVEANFDLMRAEHCWEPVFEGDGPDEMLWKSLSKNPHKKAIDFLLQYPQHIDWAEASGNPGATRLLEKYPE